MSYLIASIAGIVGLAAGWALTATVLIGLSSVLGVVDRDGGYAMMAFFAIGPFGGLIGLLLGVWFALRWYKRSGFASLAVHVLVALLAVGVISAATAGAFWIKRPYVATNALPPSLIFEIKLPEGAPAPALVSQAEAYARRSPIELHSSENIMSAEIESVRLEEGRPVVTGRVEMYYRTRERLLVLKQPAGDVVFEVKLSATPDHSPDFGAWQAPLAMPDQATPIAGDGYAVRYRAAWEGQD